MEMPVVGDASDKGIGLYVRLGVKVLGHVNLKASTMRLPERAGAVVELPLLHVPVIRWVPGSGEALKARL
jgi:hypothetical protein